MTASARLGRALTVVCMLALLAACSNGSSNSPTPPRGATAGASSTPTAPRVSTASPLQSTSTSIPAPAPTTTAQALPSVAPATLPGGHHSADVAGHSLELPIGLTVDVFAEQLGHPRMLAFDDSGALYVTDSGGRVLKLTDADGDGVADAPVVVLNGLDSPSGIAFHDGVLYVAETGQIDRVDDSDQDGLPDLATPIITDFPAGGQHFTRTIAFGPDGTLYLAMGSSCNVCEEDNPHRAAIWRYNADGTAGELFARGLRNAVGIAIQPVSGALWATNNGRDELGDDLPPETLNEVTQGADFGWPRCHSGDVVDPVFGGEQGCDGVAQPAVKMQAHSAPLGLAFYDASAFGPDYAGGVFIAFHGSWNRSTPTGYKLVFLPFRDGEPTGETLDFVTGWQAAEGDVWGRPVDVAVAPDGSLYVSDDAGGRIYHISRAP
jgi:glucose/arabinose dehydrogenase